MADTEYTKTEVESPREGSGHSREYKFDKNSVCSINIGPTFEENIFYTSTNRMLLNFGYHDIEVNRSKIPLRY